MTWSDFYLICFAVGFCFSFFSFVFGGSRFGKLHLPHFHGHAHLPAAHGPVASVPAGNGGAAEMPGIFIMERLYRRSIRPRWRRSWLGLAARDIC
jgi:hypothetical protein